MAVDFKCEWGLSVRTIVLDASIRGTRGKRGPQLVQLTFYISRGFSSVVIDTETGGHAEMFLCGFAGLWGKRPFSDTHPSDMMLGRVRHFGSNPHGTAECFAS